MTRQGVKWQMTCSISSGQVTVYSYGVCMTHYCGGLTSFQSCTCTLAVLNCYIKLSPHVTYRLTIFKISLKLKSGEIIKKGIFPIMILCTTPCLNKSNSACATQSIYKPEYWIANHDLWFIHNTL